MTERASVRQSNKIAVDSRWRWAGTVWAIIIKKRMKRSHAYLWVLWQGCLPEAGRGKALQAKQSQCTSSRDFIVRAFSIIIVCLKL